MIIDCLHVESIRRRATKADAPLVVHANAVLALPAAAKRHCYGRVAPLRRKTFPLTGLLVTGLLGFRGLFVAGYSEES